MTRVKQYLAATTAALFVAATAFVVTQQVQGNAAPATGAELGIQSSYAFDVTDKKQLLDAADAAFLGTVLAKAKTDQEKSTTVWRVRVEDQVVGEVAGEVLVRQLGYTDDDGRDHHAADQRMLKKGDRYLLTTSFDAETGQYTLFAGPVASVPSQPGASEKARVAEYQKAARE